jgi:hypothetical protein
MFIALYERGFGTKPVANSRPAAQNRHSLLSDLQGPTPCIGVERVQIRSSSSVQIVLDFEVRGRCSLGGLSSHHCTIVDPSYGLSRNGISLRRHVERVVRRSRARFARDGSLSSRVPLFLPAPRFSVVPKTSGNAPTFHVPPGTSNYWIDERSAKERQRINQARA